MRFVLPSGASVELSDSAPALRVSGVFAGDVSGVRARFVKDGTSVKLEDLPLADFHTLRAILKKLGLAPESEVAIDCRNCGHVFRVIPTQSFELGPYRDGELDDPELDRPFDYLRVYSIDAEDRNYRSIQLGPVSVGDAGPLHRALLGNFRASPKVVRGLGVVALGEDTEPGMIARILNDATDEQFDALSALFEEAHYPARLSAPHRCPKCQVVEWVAVPAERELTIAKDPELDALPTGQPFLDLDAFESEVRESAERIYRELGVANVDLLVVDGPAECDDGGEPLLGCYRPPDPDALIPKQAEVLIFYRTFQTLWDDEGDYPVKAEIDETVRHELEHHIAYLAGSDPIDDEERAEIDDLVARRVGRREVQRRALRDVGGNFGDFLRKTWPLWLIAAAATLLAVLAQR